MTVTAHCVAGVLASSRYTPLTSTRSPINVKALGVFRLAAAGEQSHARGHYNADNK